MTAKNDTRLRRARRTRAKIRELGAHRLSVHRTAQHIYAQIIARRCRPHPGRRFDDREGRWPTALKGTSNVEAAKKVGALIAERAKAAGITKVAFDRSGFKYHGRIKALADAAREGGLEF